MEGKTQVVVNEDLLHLQNQAAALDAENTPIGQVPNEGVAPGEPSGPDYGMESKAVVDMVGALVVGYAPEAADVWSEPTKSAIAQAMAPVMEKYGMSVGTMPPELTLIVVAGPVCWQTAKIISEKRERDARNRQRRNADAVAHFATTRGLAGGAPGEPESGEAPGPAVHEQVKLYQGS